MNTFIETAIKAAKTSSLIIKSAYGKILTIDNKNPSDIKDYVTQTDKEVEKSIRKILHEAYPDHSVSGEELGNETNKANSDYEWIIDPIDGTKNFMRRLGQFAISIGLLKNDTPYGGLIYDPLDEVYIWAVRGEGVYINKNEVSLSGINNLTNACIAVNIGKTKEIRQNSLTVLNRLSDIVPIIRTPGSTAYALKELVQGKFDALIDNGDYWDWAAGLVIIKEAGGKVTTWRGEEVSPKSKYVLWSNGLLHDELLLKLGV